jgi:hypothetical protein
MYKYKLKRKGMSMFLILAILSGWLIAELKDFFYNGGIANLLAFGLLKILFISILIMGISGILGAAHIIVRIFREIISAYEWVPVAPELIETPGDSKKKQLGSKEQRENHFKRNNSN